MSYARFPTLLITLIFTALISACGDSSSSKPAGDTETGLDEDQTAIDTTGQYDLVDYLFDETLSVTLNSVSYPVTFYSKVDGVQVFQITDKFVKTLDDTIVWTTDNSPSSTYKITSATIEETVNTANDALRITQRFVDVGDVYLNATYETSSDNAFPFGTQSATCEVINHLDSIDLATLTGSFSLATGVYNDVLEVSCVTAFVSQGTVVPHTTLTHYFARGIGVVFIEGNILLFDGVYLVPIL